MSEIVYNFAAGPAMLPPEVLHQVQTELIDWRGTGVSVLEIGHRTQIVQDMISRVQDKLRAIMQIPSNYKVLFAHGGGQGQLSAIPMNLVKYNNHVDYLVTGIWSKKASEFAKQYANVNIVFESDHYSIPDQSEWQNKLNPNAAYTLYCPNETIDGVQFHYIPATGSVPLIADMTSSILAEPIDVNKFGVIMAATQKNLGVAGIAVIIIRDDLLNQALEITPAIWNYKMLAESNSSVNTALSFTINIMELMLDWVNSQGGLTTIAAINKRKAAKLYNYLDNNTFYYNKIAAKFRSMINVPFYLQDANLSVNFLQQANAVGLKYLQGHKLVGGCRASLYNAMPEVGVDRLIEFMQDFAAQNC